MAYASGDVVLVPFPFTDLTDLRVRPAAVASDESFNLDTGDVIVAMITGQQRFGRTDWELRDWVEAGLRLPSWVRSKFITLNQGLVRFSLGHLSQRDLEAVRERIRLALSL